MSTTWKAAIGVILVFILGWFGGALTTLVIAGHIARHQLLAAQRDPEPLAKLLERPATRGLDLDADKKQKFHELLVENIRQRMALQKQLQPQVKEINGATLQQINALLTPAQQEQFHQNLLMIKERFGRNPFNVKEEDTPVGSSPAPASPATNAGAATPSGQ